MTFNELLWLLPNKLGEMFWLPFVAYGLYALGKIYTLPVPSHNRLARAIRVVLAVAAVSLIFTVLFNGLGPWAFHLLALAMCMLLKLVKDEAWRAIRNKTPVNGSAMNRIVTAMVERTDTPKGTV